MWESRFHQLSDSKAVAKIKERRNPVNPPNEKQQPKAKSEEDKKQAVPAKSVIQLKYKIIKYTQIL
jgi:hypothetical protein